MAIYIQHPTISRQSYMYHQIFMADENNKTPKATETKT